MTDTTPKPFDESSKFVGKFFPWKDNKPLILKGSGGGDILCLPLFSELAGMRRVLRQMAVDYDGVRTLSDARQFFLSLPSEKDGMPLKVILDPHFSSDGSLAFQELRFRFN